MAYSHPKYQNLTDNLWVMVNVVVVDTFTIRTPYKILSLFFACTQNDRSSTTSLAGTKLMKTQIIQKIPSRICFITSDDSCMQPQFMVYNNASVLEFKNDFKQMCHNYGIQAQTKYKSQSICHNQMQSLSEYTRLSMIFSHHLHGKQS
jgi:hypothetical protein